MCMRISCFPVHIAILFCLCACQPASQPASQPALSIITHNETWPNQHFPPTQPAPLPSRSLIIIIIAHIACTATPTDTLLGAYASRSSSPSKKQNLQRKMKQVMHQYVLCSNIRLYPLSLSPSLSLSLSLVHLFLPPCTLSPTASHDSNHHPLPPSLYQSSIDTMLTSLFTLQVYPPSHLSCNGAGEIVVGLVLIGVQRQQSWRGHAKY